MSWSTVINQQRAIEPLRRAITSARVAHAYLFHGSDGVGKRAAGLVFAQALQCERIQQSGDAEPCGACLPCTKVRRMLHPDVRILIPQPRGADPEDIAERIRLLGQKPYAAVDFIRRPSLGDPTESSNKQAFYAVDRIHDDLLRPMSLKPLEGRYKVAIITDVEEMRTEAANAFLKLLEEPPDKTVFILTTNRPERLLPTIISRCQQLRFDPLPSDLIAEVLVEREEIAEERAAMIARMADGSYSRALDLISNEELLANRALVLDFLRYSYTGKVPKLFECIDEITGMGREGAKGVLDLMLRWLRDLMLYRTLGRDAQLVNVDQQQAVERFCANVPDADIEAMTRQVEQARELTERNIHLGLLFTTLAQALAQSMRGRGEARLYVPLPEADLKRIT